MSRTISVRKALIAMPLIIFAIILASPFLNYAYLWGYKEFKSAIHITDPANPNFNPKQFDPANYAFMQDLGEAMQKMFPRNTPRSVVDSILVDAAHAQVLAGENADGVGVMYVFPNRFMPLPNVGLQACPSDHKWLFHAYYTHPQKPGDTTTMFLQKITWVPFC